MTNDPDVEIRRPHDHELEDVVRLRWIWNVDERGQTPDMDEQAFIAGAAAWARTHSETHIPHAAVSASGAVVGMAWLALTARVASTSGFDRLSGDLQSCFVMEHLRGRGIGGRLVSAVLATARAAGAEHVTVHTSEESPAMYVRNGFRRNGRLLYADGAAPER